MSLKKISSIQGMFTVFTDLHSDISVESGVFVGCNFETDTCEWRDISVGQFVWKRDQNGTITANTGPSVDHTTGTELGKILLEKKKQSQNSEFQKLLECRSKLENNL